MTDYVVDLRSKLYATKVMIDTGCWNYEKKEEIEKNVEVNKKSKGVNSFVVKTNKLY